MQSTLNVRPTDDPHDFVVVPPDAVRVVPSEDELSHVLRDAARHLSDPQAHAESGAAAVPPVDASFRASAVDDILAPRRRSSLGTWASRGLTAFLFAALTGVAGIAWQFYGAPVKQMIAEWTPLALSSSQAAAPATPAQAPAPADEPAAANAAASPPAVPAQAAAETAAPAAAAPSSDQSQVLQTMARDVASATQEIEQLKASIEQLKAGQQQMARELAKASESHQHVRTSAASPRAAAAPARKPPMPYPPRQAAVTPAYPPPAPYMPPPPQATAPADPGVSSVPRPPMPVR